MIIKLMSDEEKKRPFNTSEDAAELGIAEKFFAKKKQKTGANENDKIVESFLQSLASDKQMSHSTKDTREFIGVRSQTGERNAPQIDSSTQKPPALRTIEKKAKGIIPPNNPVLPVRHVENRNNPTPRISASNQLDDISDQDFSNRMESLQAIALDRVLRANRTAEEKTSCEAVRSNPAVVASQPVAPLNFPSGFAHQQFHHLDNQGYLNSNRLSLHASLPRHPIVGGIPPHMLAPNLSIQGGLSELRRLQAQQQYRSLPMVGASGSFSSFLPSLYSHQNHLRDVLVSNSTDSAFPSPFNHQRPLFGPFQQHSLSGFGVHASSLGNMTGYTDTAAETSNLIHSGVASRAIVQADLSSQLRPSVVEHAAREATTSNQGSINFLPPRRVQQTTTSQEKFSLLQRMTGTETNATSAIENEPVDTKNRRRFNQEDEDRIRKQGTKGVRTAPIYMDCDEMCLSKFQCLARKQIEIFEANEEDVQTGARGRNNPIVLGQVGIRCRHCAHLPHQTRTRGAVYYPTKFDRVYQTAVNMASIHLCNHCTSIPDDVRKELLNLKDQKSIAGGGKDYWASGVRMLGIVETEEGLRFSETTGNISKKDAGISGMQS